MSTDILRNYEQQFGILCADITSKISKSVTSGGEKISSNINSIETLFQDAKEIIEQMELEIRDMNSLQKRTPEQKEKYLKIINGYKSELSKLELEFDKQIKSKKTTNTFEISLNDSREDSELNELKQQNQSSLHKMNNKLENSYKIVLESEEAGKNILSDLFSQREQVQRARDRLREVNTNLGKSSRVVGQMAKKALQNKIVLFAMCILLILVVVFVIYLVIRKKLNK